MYHRISPAAMAQIFIKGHDVNLGKTKQLNRHVEQRDLRRK